MSVLKKLLLLSTGGTVASLEGENGLVPGMEPDQLLSYIPDLNEHCQIDSKSLMNLDSTNMQPECWIEMAKAIEEHYNEYDGFVITHGTDTMAYTSAALSYMLQHSKNQLRLQDLKFLFHLVKRTRSAILQMRFALHVRKQAESM